MSTWEERVISDAQILLTHMQEQYRADNRIPFSIGRLFDELPRQNGKRINRERIIAALASLVFSREKKVGVSGQSADSAVFDPLKY